MLDYNLSIGEIFNEDIQEVDENLKIYYNSEKDILQKELINACNGINNLPKQKIRIPVFTSDITSNPHGFDKKICVGKYL